MKNNVRLSIAVSLLTLLCAATVASSLVQSTQSTNAFGQKPLPAPARWHGLIGEYGSDNDLLLIFEKDGKLCALFNQGDREPLQEISRNTFNFSELGSRAGQSLTFFRDARGRTNPVDFSGKVFKRRVLGPEQGKTQLLVRPVHPVAELIKKALAAQPPEEIGEFLAPDLVEVKKLDPTIRLDIRYATTNNLFGTVFYSEPRAFLQRPAAEALVRINTRLKKLGYVLLVHDAYRPWYVTKVFWDATPEDKKVFVADPSKGSRHNRGAAVDLTLYDLRTRRPVEMVSTYDETTQRAYPDYPGGTSLQRWHRDLLRTMMEADGFKVYEAEWWHFDYNDWRKYPIGNQPFERLGVAQS